MGNDRVAAVDDLCVVTSLVEHTEIQSENVCEEDCASHTAFIRLMTIMWSLSISSSFSFFNRYLINW